MAHDDTIIALATPSGMGAISILRISGKDAIHITSKVFESKFGKDLLQAKSHTIHLGNLVDNGRIIDEVLVSIFKGPNSYTGEHVVEINCHGSIYIQKEIMNLFLKHGCRTATNGEYTLRAFINGKLDLSQAEAVSDLIASDSQASHQIALQQMRGGFSNEIKHLREQLLNFASLIELELDFSEEDVEFADRTEFTDLLNKIGSLLKSLIDSFAHGNVFKHGIPVAIVGKPNVGKSTLLNALLNEEKAIVSSIAGTTRDAIEDEIIIEGITYRFIDTAGIRNTDDFVENIGIEKTYEKIEQAQLVIHIIDGSSVATTTLKRIVIDEQKKLQEQYPEKRILTLVNKADLLTNDLINELQQDIENLIIISAKEKSGIEILKLELTKMANTGLLSSNQTIVSNSRHFEALSNAHQCILEVQNGIQMGISSDLLAIDIRQTLYHLGEITGSVSNDELLGNIFANFCIGK